MHYWFRQFKEEPLRVMIVMCLAALVWLYQDGQKRQDEYREDAKAQNALLAQQLDNSNKTLGKVCMLLEKLDVRMGHLEREHEQQRYKK